MLPNGHVVLPHEEPREVYLDPRVKRTRQLLVQAFVEVSKEKDFSAITIQDITERATVNRATFYAHFEDKYALLNYYVRESFGEKVKSRMERSCAFSFQNLRLLVITTCEYMAETHAGCRHADSHLVPQLRTQVQTLLYTLMLRWIESLPARPVHHPIAPEFMASTLSWTIFGAAIQWATEEQKRPASEVASQVADLITGGLTQYVNLSAFTPPQPSPV